MHLALNSIMEGRTVITIAHRLSTMKAANKIAVLENGKVVEIDTFDNLMKKGKSGKFAQLVKRQQQSGEDRDGEGEEKSIEEKEDEIRASIDI